MGWRGEAGGGSGGLEREEVKPGKKGEWTESAFLFFTLFLTVLLSF